MYKVVENVNGKRYSCFIETRGLRCRYLIGKSVTAPVGGLCVFSAVRDARAFADAGSTGLEIWRCRTHERVVLPRYRAESSSTTRSDIRKIWDPSPHYSYWGGLWPSGTVAVRTVTLTTQVG